MIDISLFLISDILDNLMNMVWPWRPSFFATPHKRPHPQTSAPTEAPAETDAILEKSPFL